MSGLDKITDVDSTFEKLRTKYHETSTLYEDPEFPATTQSVYFTRQFGHYPNHQYMWLRPPQICKYYRVEPEFFVDGGSRFDLIQGELGNCWVIAAAACLSEDWRLLERVVPPGQSFKPDWYTGMFRFRFWQYGEWVEIVIDDRLPTVGGELVFVRSNRVNEFWGALLEKAYAKLHGSYEALRAGNNGDALTDFTGGLVETYYLYEPPVNLAQIMHKAFARRSLIGGAIYGDASRNVELPNGLVTGHAYSITSIIKVNVAGYPQHLVRVRNPWGSNVEWKGAWSDKSSEWRLLTQDQRQKIGLIIRNDGDFWMDIRDFQKNFHAIEICNLTADALLETQRTWIVSIIHSEWKVNHSAGGRLRYETFWKNPQIKLRVDDSDEDADNSASFVVELIQKDRRKSKQSGLDNLVIGFVIYQLPSGIRLPLNRNFFYQHRPVGETTYVNSRSVVERFVFPPGEFVIIPTTWEPSETAKFTLRVFSEAKHTTNAVEESVSYDEFDGDSIPDVNNDPETIVLRKYFESLAGPDKETDVSELKKCLDFALAYEDYGHLQFKYSTCKYLIVLVDANFSGKLSFSEFYSLWMHLKKWLKVFVKFDKDKDGLILASDISEALEMMGFNLDSDLVKSLIFRYSTFDNKITFNKFIFCAAKIRMLFNRFRAGPRTEGSLSLNFRQWLKTGFDL